MKNKVIIISLLVVTLFVLTVSVFAADVYVSTQVDADGTTYKETWTTSPGNKPGPVAGNTYKIEKIDKTGKLVEVQSQGTAKLYTKSTLNKDGTTYTETWLSSSEKNIGSLAGTDYEMKTTDANGKVISSNTHTNTSPTTYRDVMMETLGDGSQHFRTTVTDTTLTDQGQTVDPNGTIHYTYDNNWTYWEDKNVAPNGVVTFFKGEVLNGGKVVSTSVDYRDSDTGQKLKGMLNSDGTDNNNFVSDALNSNVPKTVQSSAANSGPDGGGLVPCGNKGDPTSCNFEMLIKMVNTIIGYVIAISMPLAAIAFAYAGWLYMSAGDDTGKVSKAHHVFVSVGIGLIVLVSGWLVFKLIADNFLSDEYKNSTYLN